MVLFDEIEKAHPDVFNALLQLLDEGRLTDGQGRVVDFRNCLIIMTSNIGGDLIQAAAKMDDVKEAIAALLKVTFKPEFLNRIDETIFFNRLGKPEILKIVDIQLELLKNRLLERKITLEATPKARAFLAETGYDPLYGARPLKRTIQNLVQNPLAKMVLGRRSSRRRLRDDRQGHRRDRVQEEVASLPTAAAAARGTWKTLCGELPPLFSTTLSRDRPSACARTG